MRQSGVLPPKPSPSPSKQLSRAESKDQALEAQLRLSGVLPHHLLSEGHPALRLDLPAIGRADENRQIFVAPCVPARAGLNATTDRRANCKC